MAEGKINLPFDESSTNSPPPYNGTGSVSYHTTNSMRLPSSSTLNNGTVAALG